MDPSYPEIKDSDFSKQSGDKFYDVEGELKPSDTPEPLGMEMVIRAFVDADHAGDQVTRRSRTGFIVFVNSAPIYWLSKK